MAERYGVPQEERKFQSRMEIFRLSRPISSMTQGGLLRIVDAEKFQVVWSADEWKTSQRIDAQEVGPAGSYADIAVPPEVTGAVHFTMFWPEQNRWLGRNWDITVHPVAPTQGPVANRPQS